MGSGAAGRSRRAPGALAPVHLCEGYLTALALTWLAGRDELVLAAGGDGRPRAGAPGRHRTTPGPCMSMPITTLQGAARPMHLPRRYVPTVIA